MSSLNSDQESRPVLQPVGWDPLSLLSLLFFREFSTWSTLVIQEKLGQNAFLAMWMAKRDDANEKLCRIIVDSNDFR